MSTVMPLCDVSNAPPSRLLRPKFFGSQVNGRENLAFESTRDSSREPSSPSAVAHPSRRAVSTPNSRRYDASPCQPRPTARSRVSQKQDDTTPRSKKSYSGMHDATTPRQSTRARMAATTAATTASRPVNAPRTAAVSSSFAPKPRTITPRPRAPVVPRNPSPAQRGSGVTSVTARARMDSGSARRSAETTANGKFVATPSRTQAAAASAEEVANLKKRSAAAQAEFDRLLTLKSDLQSKIQKLRTLDAEAVKARLEAEKDIENTREESRNARPQWEKQVGDERRRLEECAARNVELQAALDEETDKVAVLGKSIAQRKLLIARENKRVMELQLEAEKENAEEVNILAQLSQQNEKLEEYANVCKWEAKMRGEQVLRQMHYFNEYMEAKGNIRVFVRMRPPGENEQCITVEENKVSLYSVTHKNVDGLHDQTSRWQFAFDRVFPEDSSQQLVFDEISLLVQSALDGFKVAIFAYGQTGSGKTYTMEGPYVSHHERRQRKCSRAVQDSAAGMIPRALRLIFNHIEKLAMTGWEYSLSASYVEIYNEAVRDLLETNNAVELKHDHGETTMNCKVVEVVNEHQIISLLAKACEARATASTFTNDRSSRSHSVFQLRINARGAKNTELKGLLSLVDLAGSERIEKSQAVGERLKEAQSINKSLSALGDVIQSLAENASHVPYRNSKLTMLLRDSLGGDSKTLMFANICPTQANLQESVNTLRFASKVNSVKKDARAKKKQSYKS
eukprot:GEMP01004077.1.p1 GENE.GEMP01004077.1~~GEMP01004077.1.p1  ORF type:complete len:740 (+),score=194.61 GEMP01004077.1:125-2344(+)